MKQADDMEKRDLCVDIAVGNYRDIVVNGQTFRICGEARLHPKGYVWYATPGDGTFMDLNEIPIHGRRSDGTRI